MNIKKMIKLCEEGRLFVKCLKTVEDDEDIYCTKGKEYEIIDLDEDDNTMMIEIKNFLELKVFIDDKDFEIIVKALDEYKKMKEDK